MKAYNAGGSSSVSSIASNMTLVAPPSAPAILSAVPAATNQINITWENISNETSYTLYRNTSNDTNLGISVIIAHSIGESPRQVDCEGHP